jgi:hypothetical protein
MKVHATRFKNTCGQARRWKYLENLQFSDRPDEVTCKVCIERLQGWHEFVERLARSSHPKACKTCSYYHGFAGVICAVHPHGKEDCPDREDVE